MSIYRFKNASKSSHAIADIHFKIDKNEMILNAKWHFNMLYSFIAWFTDNVRSRQTR
jgi:hypothetical protein